MTLSERNISYGATTALFLAATLTVMWKYPGYLIMLMTFCAVAGTGLLIALTGFRHVFALMMLVLPLSFEVAVTPGSEVQFPSELLAAAIAVAVGITAIRTPQVFAPLLRTGTFISLVIFMSLSVALIPFSEMPLVSTKATLIRLLYATAFLGGGYLSFREAKDPAVLIKPYMYSLLIVMIFILYKHAQLGFSKDASGFVTEPFFRDHTIYSTCMAFILPFVFHFAATQKGASRWFFVMVAIFLMVALLLASSRAALLSILIAAIVTGLLKAGLNFNWFLTLLSVTIFFVAVNFNDITGTLKSVRADSNAKNASIEDQTLSVVDISTDQSNAERINRWKCALRMFAEKPFTGFGPGTYQFEYFPFQRQRDMTMISVTSPYNIEKGRGGTAHNEYLLVLSESGLPAALAFLFFILLSVKLAFRHLKTDPAKRGFHVAMLFAFMTFLTHSLFNNFLDTDKAAALFYLAIAWMVYRESLPATSTTE